MKRIIFITALIISLLIFTVLCLADSGSKSNSYYTLNGTSNLSMGTTSWSASSYTFTSSHYECDWIYLHSYVYVNGILLHDEDNEKTNSELVNWTSQDWNRDDSFYSFENMTYHSSVDDNGSLSFVTDEIY